MTSEKLLAELQKAGLIDEASARKLTRETVVSGKDIEALIYERRLVGDVEIAQIKAQALGVPYRKIDWETYDNALLEIIPEETTKTYGVVPLSKDEKMLVVGMLRPDDMKSQDALKFIARKEHLNLGIYLIAYGDYEEALKRYSPYRAQIKAAVESLHLKNAEGDRDTVSLEAFGGGTSDDAPVIKIVADTFREAVAEKASDVHIEPQENYLRVRLRVDGDLREVASLPRSIASAVISRIKVVSRLKIDENRVPQDGRFRSRIFDRDIDFRVSTFPTPLGEKVAIRILDPQMGLRRFDDGSLIGRNLEMVKASLDKPFGMILSTGPTGSGKTTTLYTLLRELNKEDVNIVSLEDPVEYFVAGVNQSQVRPEIGYDFASGLRQILRQDPDIIMVGEIRDNETASLAAQAAITGHIVLSTLHTNNAAGVIPRLIDMKVEPFLLPVSLNLMMAQRLIGTICPDCKAPEEAPPGMVEVIKKSVAHFPKTEEYAFKEPYMIYHAKGCKTCKGRGSIGRMPIYEVLQMTPQLGQIIEEGAMLQKIVGEARRQGMLSLRDDGVLKALKGLLSMEEVIRETEEL